MLFIQIQVDHGYKNLFKYYENLLEFKNLIQILHNGLSK